MRYIVISSPRGVRKVEEHPVDGASFRLAPDEQVIGAEGDHDCEYGHVSQRRPVNLWALDKLASHFGVALADLILHAAKAFDIEPCAACEMRYKILRSIEQIGWFKAIKLIAKTIRGKDLSDAEAEAVNAGFRLIK